MRKRIAATLFFTLIAGCGQEADEPGAQASSESWVEPERRVSPLELTPAQEDGRQLFDVFCWTCHGRTGRGDGPALGLAEGLHPPNFIVGGYAGVSPEALEERLRASIDSVPERMSHMRFVRSIVRADNFAEALSYIPALVYPAAIPGSAIAGRDIYTIRCQICHGETGTGDGYLGRSLSLIKPADFTHDTLIARQDWEALLRMIRKGGKGSHTAMPPFGSFFSEDEMWDLVAFIATLQPGVLPSIAEETGG